MELAAKTEQSKSTPQPKADRPSFESVALRHRDIERAVRAHPPAAIQAFLTENAQKCERMALHLWGGNRSPNARLLQLAGHDLDDLRALCRDWAIGYTAPPARAPAAPKMPDPGLLQNYLRQRFVELVRQLKRRSRDIDPTIGTSSRDEVEAASFSSATRGELREVPRAAEADPKKVRRLLAERLAGMDHPEALALLGQIAEQGEHRDAALRAMAWLSRCEGECPACRARKRAEEGARVPLPPKAVLPRDVRGFVQQLVTGTGERYGSMYASRDSRKGYLGDLRIGGRLLLLLSVNADGTYSPTSRAYELCRTEPGSEDERRHLRRGAESSPSVRELGIVAPLPETWQDEALFRPQRAATMPVACRCRPAVAAREAGDPAWRWACSCPYWREVFRRTLAARGLGESAAERRVTTMLSWRLYLLGDEPRQRVAELPPPPEKPFVPAPTKDGMETVLPEVQATPQRWRPLAHHLAF